jgi:hypothetical protein
MFQVYINQYTLIYIQVGGQFIDVQFMQHEHSLKTYYTDDLVSGNYSQFHLNHHIVLVWHMNTVLKPVTA